MSKIDYPNYNSYNAQHVNFFIKDNYFKAQKNSSGSFYNYQILQNKADCMNKKISILGYIKYSKNGIAINSNDVESKWITVFPDSTGEVMLNAACYFAGYRDKP